MNCLEYSPNYIYQNYLGALKMLGLLPQTYRMRISGREAREAPFKLPGDSEHQYWRTLC